MEHQQNTMRVLEKRIKLPKMENMKSINDLKIGTRLGLVFTLIVLTTTFGFVYTSLKTRSVKNELDKIYKVNNGNKTY